MAIAFLAGVGSSNARAQGAEWNTAATAGGSWGIPSNWQGGIVPSGAANTAGFTLDFIAGASVTLDGDRLIGTILSSGATPWNLDSGTGGTLTVAGITVIGGPVFVNTSLAGVDFAKEGNGTLVLSNPASGYSGAININAGTMSLVGSANYSTAGNVLHLASGATLDVTQLTSGFRYGGAPDTRMTLHDGDLLNGAGTVKGGLKVKSGGTVYPGENGVGTLTVEGKGLFETASNWLVKLGTAVPGGLNESNGLDFSSGLTLEDGMNIIIDGNGLTFSAEQTYDYIIAKSGSSEFELGAVNFQLINFNLPGSANPASFALSSIGQNLTLRFTPIPEPAFLWAGCFGAAAAIRALRRRSGRA